MSSSGSDEQQQQQQQLELFDVTIDESNLKASIIKISKAVRTHWFADALDDAGEHLRIVELNGGITNKLVACFLQCNGMNTGDTLLFRLYGNGTDKFISRSNELDIMRLMKRYELGPQLYAKFANGICYEFLPGAILDQRLIYDERVYPAIARAIAKLHFVDFAGLVTHSGRTREPFIFPKIRELLALVRPDFAANMAHMATDVIPSWAELSGVELDWLERYLTECVRDADSLIVLSHNDLLLGNIIYSTADTDGGESSVCIKFIDYEYGEANYQAYDIANHFNEYAGVDAPDYSFFPSDDYQRKWLRVYLDEFTSLVDAYYSQRSQTGGSDGGGAKLGFANEADAAARVDAFMLEVNKFTLASHFMWAVWSMVQAQSSQLEFNFLNYARIRFEQYFAIKKRLLSSAA